MKTFRYDKLNRIKQMQTATLNGTNWGNPAYNFATLYSYDFNGNITSLYRNNAFQQTLHNIAYQYNVLENRLRSITATGLNSSSYQYDAVGNLTHDSGERLRVAWNAAGKVDRIWRNDSLLTMFRYNPTGQRQVKQRGDTTDYYLHDATGNVMCIYTHKGDTLTAIERPFYGSKRLGESEQRFLLGPGGTLLSYDTATIGLRRYELTDHLGNVMAVISDRKIGVDTDSDGYVNYYAPEIIAVYDYYPYGYPIRERCFSREDYRYFFNGQEVDNEVLGDGVSLSADFWQYDSRLGRRWNVDPVFKEYESPYACFAGNPVRFVDYMGIDTSFANNEARVQFNDTYKKVCDEINTISNAIEELSNKWSTMGYDNKKINKRMTRDIKELNSRRLRLIYIKDAFEEVISSKIMFYYFARPNPEGKYLSGGGISYNKDDNKMVIWFYSGLPKTLVHETRHGAGFSWGEWGWNNETSSPTYYDYQDEFEAYMLSNYYGRMILKEKIKNKKMIIEMIETEYGNKDNIIKEFEQHCAPDK